jgi:hypothetical protein
LVLFFKKEQEESTSFLKKRSKKLLSVRWRQRQVLHDLQIYRHHGARRDKIIAFAAPASYLARAVRPISGPV